MQADDSLIALKSLDTFVKVADGRATKIIIPSDMQSLAGLAVSVKEMLTDIDTSGKYEDSQSQDKQSWRD